MTTDMGKGLVNQPLDPTNAERVSTHGLLIAVEASPGTDLNRIVFDVMAACAKNPSILNLDVEHLGEIEVYDSADIPETHDDPKLKGN